MEAAIFLGPGPETGAGSLLLCSLGQGSHRVILEARRRIELTSHEKSVREFEAIFNSPRG